MRVGDFCQRLVFNENIMNSQIVKILDETTNSLMKRDVLGLNIFRVNKVICSISGNPQLEFLRSLCSLSEVAANTGSLHDVAETPEQFFRKEGIKYGLTRIGCYGGGFYDSDKWNIFPPLFFPKISSDYINLPNYKGESLVMEIMDWDALALFISPRNEESTNNLRELLTVPFSSNDHFIRTATNYFELVMITQADGDYFTFYSQKNESFDILNQSLLKAVHIIEESDWYKTNYQNLVWDDEYNGCLVDSANNHERSAM